MREYKAFAGFTFENPGTQNEASTPRNLRKQKRNKSRANHSYCCDSSITHIVILNITRIATIMSIIQITDISFTRITTTSTTAAATTTTIIKFCILVL